MNQYVAGLSPPATAWPRRTLREVLNGHDLGWGTPLNQPRLHEEPVPALVRFRLPALHGPALHGRMVRDECELMSPNRSYL